MLGYKFASLDADQRHERRLTLDFYAFVAQYSALIVLLSFQLYFLASWITRRFSKGDEETFPPSSPYLKHASTVGASKKWISKLRRFRARARWWIGEYMPIKSLGLKGEWLFGTLWALWLLFLCMNQTGNDYLHLTKRFGILGGSQLPLHYLLALKTPYSPVQILTRLSHEQLNVAHQILGRIIHTYFVLHGLFYLNFFFWSSLLSKRLFEADVIFGILASIAFAAVGTTAFRFLRRKNYRVFYATHVLLATVVLPLLYFHVHHIRLYVWETLAVYILHSILRILNSKTYEASLSILPGTNLIHISIPLSTKERRKTWQAGEHLYLTLPSAHLATSSNSVLIHKFSRAIRMRTNPFTIASLPRKDGNLQLVARTLAGNTSQLAAVAQSLSNKESGAAEDLSLSSRVSLTLEGPYGAASRLPSFAGFESILFVAGGVGATFAVPVWRNVMDALDEEVLGAGVRIRFIWAVRRLAETRWVGLGADDAAEEQERRKGVEVFVTGGAGLGSDVDPGAGGGESLEMEEREGLMSGEAEGESSAASKAGMMFTGQRGRPNLAEVVTETFSGSSGSVAVIVCGPQEMTEALRREVGKWVMSGRDVYWHAEAFGL
ncbi:hypothetical protein K402DRAFT_463260 [Aulographum hederae CBS 113979]|uniref:FAD-binding FR-type domain-containing protein n=1 Tax=Aulographum hederae CBS 113979 TaxID=1176131 RepID=A0A6G1H0H3_9PEZI|nr:hypothetical protein K402DRAFT_463260 [Aulographum hederae CBS 113979]